MNLVILDRDGVINHDSDDYIRTPDEWTAISGSLEAISRLNRAGYRVVVATNQSGLRRRLFDIETLNRIHGKMHRQLADASAAVEAVFFCACLPKDHCDCYKPRPGMLLDIAARLRISLQGVPCIGDAERDVEAARSAGARPILVRTGKGERTLETGAGLDDVEVYDDLAAAVDALLAG